MREWEETRERGGGLGTSEKGEARIEDWDFPPEEVVEEVKEQMGGQSSGEAAKEVP